MNTKSSLKQKKYKRIATLLAITMASSSFTYPVISFAAEEGYEKYEQGIGSEKKTSNSDQAMRNQENAVNNYNNGYSSDDSDDDNGSGGGSDALNKVIEYGTEAYGVYNQAKTAMDQAKAAKSGADAAKSGADAAKGSADGWGKAAAGVGVATGVYSIVSDPSDPSNVTGAVNDIANGLGDLGVDIGNIGDITGGLAVIGSIFGSKISDTVSYRSVGYHGKYTCSSSNPYPTINEKFSVTCTGAPMNGAAFIVPPVFTLSATPTQGGKKTLVGGGVPWKCGHHGCWPVSAVAVTVEYNAYEGSTTMGGDMYFNGDYNYGEGFTGADGAYGNDGYGYGYDVENGYNYNPYGAGEQGTGSIYDAVAGYYGSNYENGGHYDENGNWVPGNGHYDANGNWVSDGNSANWNSNSGHYDENGNWVSDGGNSSWGSNSGHYDENGNWVPGSGHYDANGNWVSDGGNSSWSSNSGHYDENGNWVPGSGHYDANGNWVSDGSGANWNSGSGHYDENGNWVSDGSGTNWNSNSGGYYDADGNWHSGESSPYSGGHYDENGNWIPGSSRGDGYYDANGNWVSGSNGLDGSGNAYSWGDSGYGDNVNNEYRDGNDSFNAGGADWASSNGGANGGYYDADGNWHSGTNPYEGGHYDANGNWVEGGNGGYYDANGNWHEGSAYGSDNLDGYFNSSYNSDNMNSAGMSDDLTGFNAINSTISAREALLNGGHVGADGIIYDADGNAWGSASAAGLLAMEEGSDQLNNVLAQGGWIDENGNVFDANGRLVGYVVPAGSLSNIEAEAFEDNSMFARSEAMLQDFLNGLSNANGGDESLMGRITAGASGNLLDVMKSTFGLASAEDIRKETMTPQQMYDAARDLLKALGYSDEDIARGLNYDKGSAYTDPEKAWDMNRITTLQKTFKIDTHIEAPKKGNSMMNAAGSFGAVKAATQPQVKPQAQTAKQQAK